MCFLMDLLITRSNNWSNNYCYFKELKNLNNLSIICSKVMCHKNTCDFHW